jgi:hypothetical protein
MFDASRRPTRRLFCWALALMVAASGLGRSAPALVSSGGAEATAKAKTPGASPKSAAAEPAAPPQSPPALTTVADTIYLADGTQASGTVIIVWPAFVTSGGSFVAAGTTNVTLGAHGALSVALAPNAGVTPPGVYYTAVYQLQPTEVRTEYWVVPASTTPVNLAAVRVSSAI